MITEEKSNLKVKIAETEDKISNFEQELESLKEQLEEEKIIKKQHVQVKIELHKKMNEYKEKFADELQLFYEEEKNKEEVREIKERQKMLKVDLREANDRRELVRNELISLDDKINSHQQDYEDILENLTSATEIGKEEILQMEDYINKKAEEYDALALPELIDTV